MKIMHVCVFVCALAHKTPCESQVHLWKHHQLLAAVNFSSDAKPRITPLQVGTSIQPASAQVKAAALQGPRISPRLPAPSPAPVCPAALGSASSTTSLEQGEVEALSHKEGREMLMLQQQSMEGSSSQRDMAGLHLHGTKAKAKSACCEGRRTSTAG